jgi:Uma2 family endonuclease
MAGTLVAPAPTLPKLPGENDLPYSDGIPMESHRHVLQMTLLRQTLTFHWADRQDFFVGGDMFVYFSQERIRSADFRGPDVFVVLDVPRRARKSWVVWQEGKGPDVVIELLSESTAELDRTVKKQIYQNELRVPEYFWFDPESGEFEGFALRERTYEALEPDPQGRLTSRVLGLCLAKWQGTYDREDGEWLRWCTSDGQYLPTPEEVVGQEREKADRARLRAEAERRRAERLAERLRALGMDPDENEG